MLSKNEMDWFGRPEELELIHWLVHLNTADVELHNSNEKICLFRLRRASP